MVRALVNVNSAGACDDSVVLETVVEADLVSAVNNGESTDAKDAEAGRDADLDS